MEGPPVRFAYLNMSDIGKLRLWHRLSALPVLNLDPLTQVLFIFQTFIQPNQKGEKSIIKWLIYLYFEKYIMLGVIFLKPQKHIGLELFNLTLLLEKLTKLHAIIQSNEFWKFYLLKID